jgi:nicotinamidase-related amidase/type 1 glutamine amidotransferase
VKTSHVDFSLLTLLLVACLATPSAAEELSLKLRYQSETSPDSGRYHRLVRDEAWSPQETALIVCDVWDLHHSINAVRRVEELAPRLNAVVKDARDRGVTIIHAPSDCMDSYVESPARKRAIDTPKAKSLPKDIASWCSKIPAEEKVVYPVDQTDGGEDDDPAEHAAWAKELEGRGRHPGHPWKKQYDVVEIDEAKDFVSDKGEEVWSILESRGIKNVILTGVHTNMCVLGRPFGLRQMARNGKHVVLMRDMTDTMYNPARWPYVSHFTGNDLIVSHIERHICPTITSDQFIGGEVFRFKHDTRPHLAIVMAEDEYETNQSLPVFAAEQLGKAFRISLVFEDAKNPSYLPGLEVLDTADVALISVRRRPLKPEQLEIVKRFVAAGKPIVGIRTASHAFSLRTDKAPEGLAAWPEFDAQVLGGHYTGHHGVDLKPNVTRSPDASEHPILTGLENTSFTSGGSLYKVLPLADGTTSLLIGTSEGQPAEPVAWTYNRADGGRTFYTSLGHVGDFKQPEFVRLLVNGIHWSAGLPMPEKVSISTAEKQNDWQLVELPNVDRDGNPIIAKVNGVSWYRCAVRISESMQSSDELKLFVPRFLEDSHAWLNGQELKPIANSETNPGFVIESKQLEADDANLLVVRVSEREAITAWPYPALIRSESNQLQLKGLWQHRAGDNPSWSNIPLPAKFGTGPDIYFE